MSSYILYELCKIFLYIFFDCLLINFKIILVNEETHGKIITKRDADSEGESGSAMNILKKVAKFIVKIIVEKLAATALSVFG